METKWTYEVQLHDMFGSASYWYRDTNPCTGELCTFTTPEQARKRGNELYPQHFVRATIVDR